jgi:hypothetical protein
VIALLIVFDKHNALKMRINFWIYNRKEVYCHQDTKTPREPGNFNLKHLGALAAQYEFSGISDSTFV